MGIFKKFNQIFKRSSADAEQISSTSRSGAASLMPSYKGNPLCIGAVYRCADLLSNKVAILPLQYKRKKGEIFVDDTKDSLYYLLNVQPNPHMSAFDFKKTIVLHLLLKGNAYIVPDIDYTTGEFVSLTIVNPNAVTHDTVNNIYTVMDMDACICGTFDECGIIHIKNFSLDGKTGLSTLTYARLTTDVALTASKETQSRFDNGGAVKGFLSDGGASVGGFGHLQDKELDELGYDIESKMKNGQWIVALHGDSKFQQTAMSSADMQFLDEKKFSVVDVARFFGVPPFYVYSDTSNYKSVSEASASLLSDTLEPLLAKMENEFRRKLVMPSLYFKREITFDRRGLMTCDLLQKADYQTKTIASGVYSVNDWRKYENREPVEGGDEILVSTNLKGIKLLTQEAQPTEPTPTPENNNTEEDGK